MTEDTHTTSPPPMLPAPSVRYVVMPSVLPTDAEGESITRRMAEIIDQFGVIGLRFEVRYWDPESSNNYVWRGKTINAHFSDLSMAEAVVDGVRDLLVRGQKATPRKARNKNAKTDASVDVSLSPPA